MCAISGSFDKNRLLDLYKLNAYRGESSFSLSTFEKDGKRTRIGVMFQDNGPMPEFLVTAQVNSPSKFFLAHSQAPTTQTNNKHPAIYGASLLWHNGIIKQSTLKEDQWDTQALLENIVDYGWSSLSRVDGTFACVMLHNDKLYFFRNEISPLFIDDKLNLSSTKFEGSRHVTPNVVWELDIVDRNFWAVADFKTMENPYYMET